MSRRLPIIVELIGLAFTFVFQLGAVAGLAANIFYTDCSGYTVCQSVLSPSLPHPPSTC